MPGIFPTRARWSRSGPIASFFSAFLDPQICILCGNASRTALPLCVSCFEAKFLAEARNPRLTRCLHCGKPLISAVGRCVTCRDEADDSSPLDGIHSLFPYSPACQDLLTRWKIEGLRGLGVPLTELVAIALARLAEGEFGIVPVPPRPGKIRERGWDQMEDIARGLERRHGFYVLRPLTRCAGIQQKKLGRLGRLENLKGAIRCAATGPYPDTIFVIDDLVATGSTLAACAEALKAQGVGKVYGFTLFYD